MTKQKITLALGGGGLKGYAHLGVIAALEENGYEIAAIAGTSAGGLFGSFFAYGYSFQEILSFIDELDNSRLFQRLHSDPPSLIGLKGVYEILNDKFKGHSISSMKIPFATTAGDVNTNREVYLNCGKISDAIRATIAIPGVFPYLKMGSLTLVDGGVHDPVPVNLARCIAGKYPVVAVCLTPPKESVKNLLRVQLPSFSPIPSSVIEYFSNLKYGKALEVFLNSMDVMQIAMADMQLQLTQPEVSLRPDTSKYYFLDDVDPEELISNGEKIVLESLDSIERGICSFHPPKIIPNAVFLSDLNIDLD